MTPKVPYEAAVIRVAPDPSSGEQLNVGLVVFVPSEHRLIARFTPSWARVHRAFPNADVVHMRRVARAVERACQRFSGEQLPLLRPKDSLAALATVLPFNDAAFVSSVASSGITSNAERTLEELFQRFVMANDRSPNRSSRSDDAVWRRVAPALRARGVLERLQPCTLGVRYVERFDHSWQNGCLHVVRPLSFDLVDPQEIVRKAAEWTGRVRAMDVRSQDAVVVFVVGRPDDDAEHDVRDAADDAIALLREQLAPESLADVVEERDAADFAQRIERDLRVHWLAPFA